MLGKLSCSVKCMYTLHMHPRMDDSISGKAGQRCVYIVFTKSERSQKRSNLEHTDAYVEPTSQA